MAWFKKKTPEVSEEEIQEKIRTRILKEAQLRDGKQNSEEATQATLDAMEDIVSLSREEMEQIADEVREESKKTPSSKTRKPLLDASFLKMCAGLALVVHIGTRRGPSWLMIFAAILLFLIAKRVWKHFKNDDQ